MDTLTSAYRDLKIRLLNDQIQFCIDKSSIPKFKHQLRFIKSLPPDCLITGSTALNLFGLIDRDITDIDILIQDENQFLEYRKDEVVKLNKEEWFRTTWSSYTDEANLLFNRLGYIEFIQKKGIFSKKRRFVVDFFKTTGTEKFIQFEFENYIYKVQNPSEIIACKMQLFRKNATINRTTKHYNDLTYILNEL